MNGRRNDQNNPQGCLRRTYGGTGMPSHSRAVGWPRSAFVISQANPAWDQERLGIAMGRCSHREPTDWILLIIFTVSASKFVGSGPIEPARAREFKSASCISKSARAASGAASHSRQHSQSCAPRAARETSRSSWGVISIVPAAPSRYPAGGKNPPRIVAAQQSGTLLQTIVGGPLTSPWGIALAPAGFRQFGGDLLVDGYAN